MTGESVVGRVASWAGRKGRTVDVGVLESVLRVRAAEGVGVGAWPPGSVVDLLLVHWPASGEELPEREVLSTTLDTFWRFLRATGAMAHASAHPRALVREFGQAALLAYLPATTAPSIPSKLRDRLDLQDRLEREAEMRNASANAERFWEEADRPRSAFRPAGDVDAALTEPAWFARSSPSKCAPVVRKSPFVQECLRVADWVGTGRAVSSSGYPLDSFEDDGVGSGVIEPGLMWVSCVRGGLIDVVGDRAVATGSRPATEDEWADLGLQLAGNLLICLDRQQREPVLYAVTGLFSPGFGGWAKEVLLDWWWSATINPVGQRTAAPDPGASRDGVLLALELLETLGVLEAVGDDGNEFVPTALGRDVGLAVLHLGMQGVFLEAS